MNSDKPDPNMENNAITSKNKKKSKGNSKTNAALTDVIGRAPKKSFWRSLFRFKKHQTDPGNSSTHVITVELGNNNDEEKTTPNQRLSSIFEETTDPGPLDPKTIEEDICEIKKTIKRMSETSNPSVIIDKINQNYPLTQDSKKRNKDDTFLGYLTDVSSTLSEDEDDESEEKLEEQPSQEEGYCGITNQDNNSTYTDLLADDKPNKGSNSLLKEGYSFEYSETSEISNDGTAEEKPEKVTFDNKVETKDANSIIMVRPLDEIDSKAVIEGIVGSAVVQKDEFVMNIPQKEQKEEPQEEPQEEPLTEEEIIVARIHKLVNPSKYDENLIMLEEEEQTTVTSNTDNQSFQKSSNRTFFSIPQEEVDPSGAEASNRFVEESDPSTSSISKHSTYVHQDFDETLDIESIEEETELWMEDLNDFSFITSADMLPLEDLDDDANIDNEIFREFRLNKFFKMIQNNITMNVSIAYDPLFENEPMLQNFHSALVEQEVRNEERNKVIRKRKMMSLLHDKQVFKDYLKEIEEANVSAQNQHNTKRNEETEESNDTILIKKASETLIDIDEVPRANIFNEATLLNLQTTKNKLEKFLTEEPGIQSTYPKQYLRIYNLQTNHLNEGLEEPESNSTSPVIGSDTSVGKSTTEVFKEERIAEKLSPSLQTKINVYETIDRDVEQVIMDLMGHVTDLKETCIKYGADVSNPSKTDLIITKKINVFDEVQEIMDEILEKVFEPKTDVLQLSKGHFNQCFSFIREFGKIQEDKTALSYQIKPIVKSYYQTESSLTLIENLQRANGYLSTVYEEMCEYNPIPMLGNEDFQQNENIQYIDESIIDEPITDQSYNENLIDFTYQPNFEMELSVINEEEEPNSSTDSIPRTTSMDIAENIIQFIETSVSEKLSSGRNNCEDYDEETVNITEASNSKSDKKDENITAKFSDFAIASNSRDNKFEPQPGTSKQATCFMKADKSSATICSSVYHLPSVPSTELISSSQHSIINNKVETLLTKKFSELPNNSTEDIKPEELQALLAFQVPSNFSQGATILERKSPQTNLLEILPNLKVDDVKNLSKSQVDKCIEENLRSFQESIKETIKLNQKTIEMIQNSSDKINAERTPDILTIISTLSCNIPDNLQEQTGPTKPTKQNEQKELKEQKPSQEWYGNNFFSKTNPNNSVPKLCQLSEKIYAQSETDKDETKDESLKDESTKDDTESAFSNHNFDVDTYTDISFEESTGLNLLKQNGSETITQSELSLDTEYLSCSNFSSRCDSGKTREETTWEEASSNTKSEKVAAGASSTTTKICTEIKNLINGDLTSKYLEKRFNFGVNLSTMLNEEFKRKAKLNFGEQM